MKTGDVLIAGLGTAGAATCMELARRGVSVVGLDAFRPPHDRGSHHGRSRSIRRAYLEGSGYVPLVLQAWELWRRLERDTGKRLLVATGNLTVGPPEAPAVKGFLASARKFFIPHEALTAAQVRRRWPQLTPPDSLAAGLEVEAGVLFPERCITALLNEAERAGATLRFDEPVTHWSETGGRIRVHTAAGKKYEAGRLLLAAGARNKTLLGRANNVLAPKRVPVFWVTPPAEKAFRLGAFPVNFWQLPAPCTAGAPEYREFYTLPITRSDGSVKAAPHNRLADCAPDVLPRKATAEEAADIRGFLAACIPALAGSGFRSEVCMYTLTPDNEFLVGALPGHPNVFAAALAGHGFKFAPALGVVLADLITATPPAFDVSMFSFNRFFSGGPK